MASFQDVIKRQKRMCMTIGKCDKCPLCSMDYDCRFMAMIDADYDRDEVEAIEYIVMNWAATHPEPRYPTFKEWIRELPRVGLDLDDPIPEDIAKALKLEKIEAK